MWLMHKKLMCYNMVVWFALSCLSILYLVHLIYEQIINLHTHTHTHTHTHIITKHNAPTHARTQTCTYKHTQWCLCVFVCIRVVHVCLIDIYDCIYVCLYLYMYKCVYIYTYICVYIYTYICVYTYTDTCVKQ